MCREPVHGDVVAPGVRRVEDDRARDLRGRAEDGDVRDGAVARGERDARRRRVGGVGRQRCRVLLRTAVAAKGLLGHKNTRGRNRLFIGVHSVTVPLCVLFFAIEFWV